MHFHMIPTKRKLILFKNKFMESKSVFLVTWPPFSTGRGKERTSDLPYMALSAFYVLSQLFLTAVLGIVLLAPFCLWKTVSKVLTNSSSWTGISSGANADAASMEHALFKAGVVPFFWNSAHETGQRKRETNSPRVWRDGKAIILPGSRGKSVVINCF